MAYEYDVLRDIDNLKSPGFTDQEYSKLLSIAERNIVVRKYTGSNQLSQSFEETEKRRKDLSELTKTGIITSTDFSSSQVGILPNGTFIDLPSDFLYAISETCTISYTDCNNKAANKVILVKPITHDEYAANIENPFKQPSEDLIWRLDYSRASSTDPKRHELITDGSYDIVEYKVRYISRPQGITVDRTTPANQINSVLDESVHSEIVQEAVRLSMSITEDTRYQLSTIESTLKE